MNFSLRIILVFFCCLGGIGYAQNNLSKTIDSILNISKAEDRALVFEQLITTTDLSKNTETIARLFHETGRSYYKTKNYEKALFYLSNAIEIKKQLSDKTSLNKSLFLKAYIYNKQENIAESYKILLEIISVKNDDIHTCYAYKTLAEFEADKGDFYKALDFLNTALSNKTFRTNSKYKSQLSRTILWVYGVMYESGTNVETNKADLAIVQSHQKTIEQHIEIISKVPFNLASTYNNLAIVYDSFLEFDEALKFYKIAEKIYKSTKDLYYELDVVLNIGVVYSKQGKHQLANQQYQCVINESDDIYQIANAYDNLGYYLNTEFATEKIPFLEKAVTIGSDLQKEAENGFQLPTIAQIKTAESEQDVLIYLIDLADHYVKAFKQKNDKEYLIKAKKTVTLIDQLVSLIRYETDTEASKLFWIEKGVNTYMLAVEICYLLNDVTNAFYFMEKNKALLLQENIKTFQTKLTLNIPKRDLEREYKLHYELISLQQQFQQQIHSEEEKQQYALKKEEYETFMDSIAMTYPTYKKTKEHVEIAALETITEMYKTKKEAFVEYILHETDGYGIYYDGENPAFFKIENVANFQEQLRKLRAFMTKRRMNSEALKTYQTIGFEVFNKLFPFKNAAQRLQNKKLTIIADQNLQYIPFEIIPMRKDGKLSDAYLVNALETSYVQSFSLFKQIQKKQNVPTEELLVIAPSEFEDQELPTLTGTTEVLEFLSKYDNSVLLTKREASKENFIKHRNNFKIIHVNTHAGLDSVSKTPWLAFNKEKMTLTELFGLENQAELVILDACKTNDGVNLSGEGIINLSRGFFYNGTQSVLASQWNVNEEAGNEILQTFYTELDNGNSKSKALQLAKKAYLQKHKNTQNIPYYWAAFTLTGSTDAVMLPSKNNNTIFIIPAVLFIVFILFFMYRKKVFK